MARLAVTRKPLVTNRALKFCRPGTRARCRAATRARRRLLVNSTPPPRARAEQGEVVVPADGVVGKPHRVSSAPRTAGFPPPLWGRIEAGGRAPNLEVWRPFLPNQRSARPPILVLPHKGGRDANCCSTAEETCASVAHQRERGRWSRVLRRPQGTRGPHSPARTRVSGWGEALRLQRFGDGEGELGLPPRRSAADRNGCGSDRIGSSRRWPGRRRGTRSRSARSSQDGRRRRPSPRPRGLRRAAHFGEDPLGRAASRSRWRFDRLAVHWVGHPQELAALRFHRADQRRQLCLDLGGPDAPNQRKSPGLAVRIERLDQARKLVRGDGGPALSRRSGS